MNEVNENKNELSFEEALAKLETIVRKLESGNARLDESLKLYEEGTSLVKYCSETLDKAQQKILTVTGGTCGDDNQPLA